ncbi:hypothetical protein C8F04DRAFT_1135780 [Mycena alexandri]|uniref:Uncharacterized protein n=1 Tax=Mycena alexandri TaxID=1745969 RepID=A0AAD6S8E0_9AGAR|nr:hypothetical protein C8F04DRAFT_1135780 [Mycena alexandri]
MPCIPPLPFFIARAFTCLTYIRATALPPPPRLSSELQCRQPHSSTRVFGHSPCAVLSLISSHCADCMLYRPHCGQGSGPHHTYPDINVAIHSAITALAFSR